VIWLKSKKVKESEEKVPGNYEKHRGFPWFPHQHPPEHGNFPRAFVGDRLYSKGTSRDRRRVRSAGGSLTQDSMVQWIVFFWENL